MHQYDRVSKAWATKFLTLQDDVQVFRPRDAINLATQFAVKGVEIQNRSASAAPVGFGGRLPQSLWVAGFWDASEYAAGTVYADDTTDAQDTGANDFPLDTVGTNNDGFVIGCDVPFNIVSVVVGTASAAATAWDLAYSIATAGTGDANNWKTLTNPLVALNFGATGEQLIWFYEPTDWAKVTAASAIANRHGASVPQKFCIRVRATTAPNATQGLATNMVVGYMAKAIEGLADNAIKNWDSNGEILLPAQCDALMAAIGTADPQNYASFEYRLRG